MATVVTSSSGPPQMAIRTVRAARPEAIIIVLFLVVVLFLFLGGSSKRSSQKQKPDSKSGASDLGGSRRERSGPKSGSRGDERRSRSSGGRGSRDDAKKTKRTKKKDDKKSRSDRRKRGSSNGKGRDSDTDTSAKSTTTSATDTSDEEKKKERQKERDAKKKKQREDEKKREKEKEKERERGKKEEKERKEREQARRKAAAAEEEEARRKKKEADEQAKAKAKAEAEAVKPSDPLSDVIWKRDPSKRPERPSGRSPPVLLKRDESGRWTRPPLSGKKGVMFNDHGVQGKEADTMVTYNHEDPPNTLYDQTHTPRFRDHVSTQQGREGDTLDGALDGSQTPFKDLLRVGGLSKKLLALMQQVEMFCLMDWLDKRAPKDTMQKAMKDRWIKDVGPIPEVICDCIQQMVIDKAVDLPLMMGAIATADIPPSKDGGKTPPDIMKGAEALFKHLMDGGYDKDYLRDTLQFSAWPKYPIKVIAKLVVDWTEKQLQTENGSSAGFMGMLLGFFVPGYRAETSFWKSHIDKQRKKEARSRQMLGTRTVLLMDWLRYVGKTSLVSRTFSPYGADITKSISVRVCAVKQRQHVGFSLDFTFFVPAIKAKDSSGSGDYDDSAMATMIAQTGQAVKRVRYLAITWIEHLFTDVYRSANSGQALVMPDFNAIRDCRLTLRPGLDIFKELDHSIVERSLAQSSQSRLKPEVTLLRQPTIMRVDMEQMDRYYRDQKGRVTDWFASAFRTIGCRSIRFINQRQFHWYNRPSTSKPTIADSERFDELTFQALLVLCSRGLASRFHAQRFGDKSGKVHDDSGAEVDSEENSAYMMARAIDFGGMVPVVISKELRVPPRFLPLDLFKHLKDIMLPLIPLTDDASQPASAALVFQPSWGLAEFIHSGGQGSVSVTFHGPSEGHRRQLLEELTVQCLHRINGWYADARREGDLSLNKIEYLKQRIEITVRTVRNKVKYVALTAESQSVENRGHIGALEEFRLPTDALPDELR
ncbi:hypothetical protein I316_02877 [Kwoniella heveanensis BCC8398]|uniref:Uncharacterized protein n=1 Tax=Kwoniella heveanensis BCC8398 TaxID=1296120 RepID=A0A1B9GWD2_9TREE|nr:hypothetical protein I316_02877 [Kwoniella heveanensis BCC8398]